MFEAKIVEAQKSADALSKAFRDLKKAASTGHLVDFEKGLGTIAQRAEQAQAAAAPPVEQDYSASLPYPKQSLVDLFSNK